MGLGRAGVGRDRVFSEMLPAVNLEKSRWRQLQAGGAVKRCGGTMGENVFVHEGLLGELVYGLSQAYSQLQVWFRFPQQPFTNCHKGCRAGPT